MIVVVTTPKNHPGADWASASPVTVTPAVNRIRADRHRCGDGAVCDIICMDDVHVS